MLRIFRHYVPLPAIGLCFIELSFIFAAFYFSQLGLKTTSATLVGEREAALASGLAAMLLVVVMFSLGLYNRAIFSSHRFPAVLEGSNSVISWLAPLFPI